MTKIEWVQNPDGSQGKTWNPITGCTPVSPGCTHCYARRMARRLAGRCGYPEYPNHFDVTLRPDRLDIPLRRKKPTMYFVCSMSDLFHEDVPDEFIQRIWGVMARTSRHTFQILTKRPSRLQEWVSTDASNGRPSVYVEHGKIIMNDGQRIPWPLPNVWLGVSVENQATADERIPLLLQTPAAVRFVSCEPLLGEIDIQAAAPQYQEGFQGTLSLVIVGGESGPGARPMHPDWAREIRDQCQDAGVPFFFKQWGAWLPNDQSESGPQCSEWGAVSPEDGEYTPYSFTGPYNYNCGEEPVYRVGKHRAGRLLDGREWNELPSVSSPRT